MNLEFTIPGPPVPKQRPRKGRGGRFYTPQKTRSYEARVKNIARTAMQGQALLNVDLKVQMRVYFPDRRRRDVDNVAKSILDALNKVVYEDDYSVQTLIVQRFIDRTQPRVEVTIKVAA